MCSQEKQHTVTKLDTESYNRAVSLGSLQTACSSMQVHERGRVRHLLERRAPAPPRRKRQLQTSMERSLPTYQFWVMFSWFTISASLLGIACTKMQPSATHSEICPTQAHTSLLRKALLLLNSFHKCTPD
jgi:hypothetical protein